MSGEDESIIARAARAGGGVPTGLQIGNLGTLVVLAFLGKGWADDVQRDLHDNTAALQAIGLKVEELRVEQAAQAAAVAKARGILDDAARRLDESIARIAVLEACARAPKACPLEGP